MGSDTFPIAVDGIFGPQTEAATIEFQQAAQVDADAVVDPIDRVTLEEAIVALEAAATQTISLIDDIPCGDPIPIETMPDGEPTTEPLRDGTEVRWSSGDPSGPGDNIVTQRLEIASEADIAEARQSDIAFTDGPLTVRVLPSTSVSDAADIYVFDDGTDCVRLINTSPFVPDDVLELYAQTLLASWTTG